MLVLLVLLVLVLLLLLLLLLPSSSLRARFADAWPPPPSGAGWLVMSRRLCSYSRSSCRFSAYFTLSNFRRTKARAYAKMLPALAASQEEVDTLVAAENRLTPAEFDTVALFGHAGLKIQQWLGGWVGRSGRLAGAGALLRARQHGLAANAAAEPPR